MFDQYTPKARAIVDRAGEEAERRGSAAITAGHLLFALLTEPDCVAVSMLEQTGAQIEAMVTNVQSMLDNANGESADERGLGMSAIAVLDLAYEEAWRRRDRHIASEHILLGLVRYDETLNEPVLAAFGVSWEQLDRAAELLHTEGPTSPSIYEALTQPDRTLASRRNDERAPE